MNPCLPLLLKIFRKTNELKLSFSVCRLPPSASRRDEGMKLPSMKLSFPPSLVPPMAGPGWEQAQ
jgi:hypothetical protein